MQESHRKATGTLTSSAPHIRRTIDLAIREHGEDYFRENGCPGEIYHTQLWTFTRLLKSHLDEEIDPGWVFWNLVHPEMERRGGWSILNTGLDLEEIYFEFVCNWDAVRFRIGETPLSNAIAKANAYPLEPRRASKRPGFLARYARFVSIAGWLQVAMGDRPILLPVDKLGEILGVRPMTVTRYRQTAVADNLLRTVKEHCYRSGRATEFRFAVSRFSVLRGKAQKGTQKSFEQGT